MPDVHSIDTMQRARWFLLWARLCLLPTALCQTEARIKSAGLYGWPADSLTRTSITMHRPIIRAGHGVGERANTTRHASAPRPNQSVVIIQTGDGHAYSDLFEQTAPANMEYAARHGYAYWRFDGVVRGKHPWHASFNRLYLFEMARQAKQYDWIFFLDNDALVVDHTKPLDEYMNATCMLVAARGISDDASAFWEINAGVMVLNLRHKDTAMIFNRWRHMYEQVGLDELDQEEDGVFAQVGGHIDDQNMLHDILKHAQPASVCRQTLHTGITINYDGSFVKHVLRGNKRLLADRKEELMQAVNRIIR